MKINQLKITIIDGYLDEPSCLGVPPYLSPHIRYLWGALLTAGINPDQLDYLTIDSLRQQREKYLNELEEKDIIILIAGTTVPGHYLGGQPASAAEIKEIVQKLFYPTKVLGGPITLIKNMRDRFKTNYDIISSEITALDIFQRLTETEIKTDNLPAHLKTWAVKGAAVFTQHPAYPNLVAEIETFRGCPRPSHCAFCSERLKKINYWRSPAEIHQEVKAIAAVGIHHYRLGSQTDILLYGAERTGSSFNLKPNYLRQLYSGIRQADPELQVLHLDNMNPAEIARNPVEAAEIIEIISKYNTPGDTAAFGLESADPTVLQKNNIDSTTADTFFAIKLLNEIGGQREDGIPKLLPGLNFLHGLIGESKKTLNYNYDFLHKLLKANLLVRRINIRQVVQLGSYPEIKYSKNKFKKYKEKINQEINYEMLKRVFPTGVILKNLYSEKKKGSLNYCRQLGTYPILTAVIDQQANFFAKVKVIDHGYRSLTALNWSTKSRCFSQKELEAIPGIGSKRASRILVEKPKSKQEFRTILGRQFPEKLINELFLNK